VACGKKLASDNNDCYVGVIGQGECGPELAAKAEEVGRRIAEAGAILVCGGMGGVMEAACRGAKNAGGTTVGILQGSERGEGNAHLSIAVATGLGEARNLAIIRTADVLIAVGGSYGTLSEIGFALKMGKKVVGLETWEIDGIIRAAAPAEALRLALED
jgi:uncharacterized protein (TIGR00725 family)